MLAWKPVQVDSGVHGAELQGWVQRWVHYAVVQVQGVQRWVQKRVEMGREHLVAGILVQGRWRR